jgi:Tol biopolymer transport system component
MIRLVMRSVGLVVALGLAVLTTGCQLLNRGGGAEGLQGRIVWPKDGDLWVYELGGSNQQRKITNLPRGAAITGASWSPDGERVVYSQFWRRPEERASGADLFVANADGSDARPFAERDAPNSVLDSPDWAPSGRVYYTLRQVRDGRESTAIVRQMEGGAPETLVQNGYSPGAAPDESVVVYLRTTRLGQEMMKKTIGESGDGCVLLSDQVFSGYSLPRVSPDGTRIAVGASGEPNPQPSACGGAGSSVPPTARQVATLDLASWLGHSVAYAHGLPADVWTFGLDGSNLVRVADLKEDEPNVAWSPDGSRIAVFGIAALYIVDARGGTPSKLVDQGGYGGLDWTR